MPRAHGLCTVSDMGDTGILMAGAVDDHPAILRGLMAGLRESLPNLGVPVVGTDVRTFLSQVDRAGAIPQVVLLDLSLGDGTHPADNVADLKARGMRVLLFTQEVRLRPVATAFKAGADGLVGKHESFEVIASAILEVARGGVWLPSDWAAAITLEDAWMSPHLSPRERDTVSLYATGLPLKTVARRLNISEHTAKEHTIRVKRKYAEAGREIVSRTDYYIRAVEDGLVPPPDVP